MLKERHQVFVSLLVISDSLVVAGSEFGSLALSRALGYLPADAWLTRSTVLALAVGFPFILICMAMVGLYRPRRDRPFFSEFIDILKAAFFGWGMFVIATQMLKSTSVSESEPAVLFLIHLLLLVTLLTIHRRIFRAVLHALRMRGWNQRHFAIIGTGRLGQIAFHTFLRNSWTGINAAYFISHHDTTRRTDCLGRPVHGGLDRLEEIIEEHRVDGVVIALPQSRSYLLPKIMMRLGSFTVDVRIIPDISPRYMPINLSVHELDGMPILTMRQSPMLGYAAIYKRAVDIIVASLALIIFGLPMTIIAILIKLDSRGPIIFRQARVSVGGKPFKIFKFRTMYHGASESNSGPNPEASGKSAWTKRNDSRITSLGRILRKSSLDELPQLFNVLKGDMSLVGPRPERLDLIDDFRRDWRGYMLRQNIKPGMTGWAQINGLRGDTSLRKRLQYDLYYIRNWSLSFDLRILLLTLFRGFRDPNAH